MSQHLYLRGEVVTGKQKFTPYYSLVKSQHLYLRGEVVTNKVRKLSGKPFKSGSQHLYLRGEVVTERWRDRRSPPLEVAAPVPPWGGRDLIALPFLTGINQSNVAAPVPPWGGRDAKIHFTSTSRK